jgi:AcrR family transcriptional regulator
LRNEQAAVEAILDLLGEGQIEPTAQAVAARSGLSIRSIFRLFQDMEALHSAAIEQHTARVVPLLDDLATDGPLDERIDALTSDRARFYEAVTPVRRMAIRRASRSPVIAERLARVGRHFRRQVAEIFALELSAGQLGGDSTPDGDRQAPGGKDSETDGKTRRNGSGARDKPDESGGTVVPSDGRRGSGDGVELLEGLDAATSWEMWDRLRRAQGLSIDEARQVMVATVSALLPGAGPEAAVTAAGGTPTAGRADH